MKPRTFTPILTVISFVFCLTLQAQTLKIGHTQVDYILSQTPESKTITNQLSVQQTQLENELKRMQQELQGKYGAYQKGGATMSDVIRKDKETELQTLQTRIQEFSRTAEESLQNKYRQLVGPVLTKIQQTIDSVAKENGYTYIINTSSGNTTTVLYGSEESDVTSLVFRKLGITPGAALEKPKSTSSPSAKPSVPKPAIPKKR